MTARRDLLRGGLAAGLSGLSWRAWPVEGRVRQGRLLVVFLRGAYDCLGTVVPWADDFYHEARPGIALSRPDAGDPDAVLALDDRWGLHPVLAASVLPLWWERQLAFVPFAGNPFATRSHFEAQDLMEGAVPPHARPAAGFLNRLLEELAAAPPGVAFTSSLPPSLRGSRPVINSAVDQPAGARADQSYESLVLSMYDGHRLEEALREGLGLRRELLAAQQAEMARANGMAPGGSGFALAARRVGRFLRERPEFAVSFIDVGGWDTHAGQGGAHGTLALQLGRLGDGLAALARELGESWRDTAVVVLSEFGRTFRENGSRGTDHGFGTTIWVLGGGVKGGRIVGAQVPLRPDTLNEGRDLPVLNDYRAVITEVTRRLFGLSPASLQRVFPGASGRFDALI